MRLRKVTQSSGVMYVGDVDPRNLPGNTVLDGQSWVDTSNINHVLKSFDQPNDRWTSRGSTYGGDFAAPNISLSSPTNAPFFGTAVATVTIAGTCIDDVSVASLVYTITGATTQSGPVTLDAGGHFSFDVTFGVGESQLTFIATDDSGNISTKLVRINFDAENPQIAIVTPSNTGSAISDVATVQFAGTAVDAVGVTHVEYSIVGPTVTLTGTAAGTNNWSFERDLELGNSTVTVTAYDAGNNSASAQIVIGVDLGTPTIEIDVDELHVAQMLELSKDSLDAGSNVRAVNLADTALIDPSSTGTQSEFGYAMNAGQQLLLNTLTLDAASIKDLLISGNATPTVTVAKDGGAFEAVTPNLLYTDPNTFIEHGMQCVRADKSGVKRTVTTANANRTKWTFATWVYLAATGGVQQSLFGACDVGNTLLDDHVYIQADGTVVFVNNQQQTPTMVYTTTSPIPLGSWFHFQLVFDSTQALSTDRMKLYINNVYVPSLGQTYWIGQNGTMRIGAAKDHSFGQTSYNGSDFRLADTYLLVGQAVNTAPFIVNDGGTIKPVRGQAFIANNDHDVFLKYNEAGNLGLDSGGYSLNYTAVGTNPPTQTTSTPTGGQAAQNVYRASVPSCQAAQVKIQGPVTVQGVSLQEKDTVLWNPGLVTVHADVADDYGIESNAYEFTGSTVESGTGTVAGGVLTLSNAALDAGYSSLELSVTDYAGRVATDSVNLYRGAFGLAIDVITDTLNINVESALLAAGWDGSATPVVDIHVYPGVKLGSNATTTPALVIANLPASGVVTILNEGQILGKGGRGSDSSCGLPGENGGPAISIGSGCATVINNLGTIAGGGGGGGSGGMGYCYACDDHNTWGSPGGGGAGYLAGAGANYVCGHWGDAWGGSGGAGGTLGMPGVHGTWGQNDNGHGSDGTPGGLAGSYITGVANVTWTAQGTLLGLVS